MKEFDLIQQIVAHNAELPGHVRLGPGDDMALLEVAGGGVLVAADQVIDGVHFLLGVTPIEKIGRKAVTRNVSDIAAMAAVPVAMVCCVALPRGMAAEDAMRLLESVRATGAQYGCPLVGGDTAIYEGPLSLSVTVLATPDGIDPVTRGGALPGDFLFVTGPLGGTQIEHEGVTRHLDFEPRVELARRLAGDIATMPSAMIDLSDGLARDVVHLAPHVRLLLERLPIAEAARVAAKQSGRSVVAHALGDGEDHELLFAVRAGKREAVEALSKKERLGLVCIGCVAEQGGVVATLDGVPFDLTGLGWEHGDG